LPTRALHRKRALALPEAAHLAHAAPDVDRKDLRVLVEAGRPVAAPATLGEPAGPLAAQHRDDEKVRELPHQVVDQGRDVTPRGCQRSPTRLRKRRALS
jgi:hypothetical protein